MKAPVLVSLPDGDAVLSSLPAPLPLDDLLPGAGPWEVELGFGKGRYLLRRCEEDPGRRFLGIEYAAAYHQLFVERARRRGAANWIALRGEALYLLAAVVPRGFAAAVHVYFPDPWPKGRHCRRRLFDPATVDLVLGLLAPRGRLCFATDHLEYGERVAEILAGYPGLDLRRLAAWPEGPRTNYEAKYVAEGRPIVRLEAMPRADSAGASMLHPLGSEAVVV